MSDAEDWANAAVIVLEGEDGVDVFTTAREALEHDWQGELSPDKPLPPRTFYDLRGRKLTEVPPSNLQPESGEDDTDGILMQFRRRLRAAVIKPWPQDAYMYRDTVADIVDKLDGGQWGLKDVARELLAMYRLDTPGSYLHYCISLHHNRSCRP
jgi:hypothetical protein